MTRRWDSCGFGSGLEECGVGSGQEQRVRIGLQHQPPPQHSQFLIAVVTLSEVRNVGTELAVT